MRADRKACDEKNSEDWASHEVRFAAGIMQKRHLAAAAIFVTLSIAMTWPLAPRITHAVADPIDPFINIWILDWDYHATLHHPLSLFDADVFYPEHDSLAYSENLYGIALLTMPLRLLGLGPVTTYNIALLAGFAFSGFAAYLLGFRLTGSFTAGIALGVFHAFVPFRFTHVVHLQHVFAGWLPLLIVALVDYVDRPSRRSAAIFGFVFLMNGLTNIHWFLFGSFAIVMTALLFAINGVRGWRNLIIATCVAGALLLPFLIPYSRVARTMSRSWEETKSYSAHWSDWMVAGKRNRVYEGMRDANVNPECWLFPGFLSIALAIVAIPLVRRYPRGVTLGLFWTIMGVLGSLGLNFAFHQFLFDAVPGFRGIRVPARWAEIAYVGMAMLIAVAVAFVARRQRWIAAAIPLLLIVELRAAPIRWYRAPVEVPEVYRWLAAQNVRAVAELPIDIAGSDYLYAFRAVVHHKNLINGASGAVPRTYERFSAMSKSHPIPDEFLDELRRIGVELVLVHMDMLAPDDSIRSWLHVELQRRRLFEVAVFPAIGPGGDFVFSFKPRPANRQPRTAWTFGYLERPPPLRGKAFFSGFAVSPFGVREVDLLFEDGNVRVPATLIPDAKLPPAWGAKPRFVALMAKRPRGVSAQSDVQAEIIDGHGERTRLQYYWIDWDD